MRHSMYCMNMAKQGGPALPDAADGADERACRIGRKETGSVMQQKFNFFLTYQLRVESRAPAGSSNDVMFVSLSLHN